MEEFKLDGEVLRSIHCCACSTRFAMANPIYEAYKPKDE